MDGLDTRTMIHIGTEVLLIGGLGFWTKGKIGALEAKIENLETKLASYENIISQQQQLLSKHESAFRQIFGMPQIQETPQKSPAVSESQQRKVEEPKRADSTLSKKSPPVENSVPVEKPKEPPQEEKDITPEDLDNILKQELSKNDNIEIDTLVLEDEEKKKDPLKQKRKVLSNRKKKIA